MNSLIVSSTLCIFSLYRNSKIIRQHWNYTRRFVARYYHNNVNSLQYLETVVSLEQFPFHKIDKRDDFWCQHDLNDKCCAASAVDTIDKRRAKRPQTIGSQNNEH